MIRYKRKNLKLLGIICGVFVCSLLLGCGNSLTGNTSFSLVENGFTLNYNGKINLEKVQLKTDDLDEIVELYQEVGDNLKYRDSLLIAEKHSQGFGPNVFVEDNLDALIQKGLVLSNVKKTQIILSKYGKKIGAVLVEYEITEGLINDIPLLYVSQLFVPEDDYIVLMSFITEDKSSSLSASDMFKNIK